MDLQTTKYLQELGSHVACDFGDVQLGGLHLQVLQLFQQLLLLSMKSQP